MSKICLKVFYKLKEVVVAVQHRKLIRDFVCGYEYDEFFTYGSNMEAYIAYSIIAKNRKVVFSWYEEGVGTYINTFYSQLKPWCNLALWLMRVRKPMLPDNIWLYKPDMMCNEIPTGVKVNVLSICYDKKLLNYIWDYDVDKTDESNYMAVYFEQPELDCRRQLELISLFSSDITKVKLHPRSQSKELYRDYSVLSNQNILWELYCLNDYNIHQRIFISSYSTACFTPKMIFDEEPVVIFTYHLYSDKQEYDRIELLIDRFRTLYKCKDRVIIPKSEDELKSIINKLKL